MRALSVSRSGYYAWRHRPESPRARANRVLLVRIRALHAESLERLRRGRGAVARGGPRGAGSATVIVLVRPRWVCYSHAHRVVVLEA